MYDSQNPGPALLAAADQSAAWVNALQGELLAACSLMVRGRVEGDSELRRQGNLMLLDRLLQLDRTQLMMLVSAQALQILHYVIQAAGGEAKFVEIVSGNGGQLPCLSCLVVHDEGDHPLARLEEEFNG